MIIKALKFVNNKLTYLIMVSMFVGLIYGYGREVTYLKKFVPLVSFLMIYPMMINLNILDFFKSFSNSRPILLSIGINFIISPIFAYYLGKTFFGQYPELLIGLILIALIPTSGMTASWTGLSGGNIKSALVIISANLILSIIMIPLYMKLLLGQMMNINTLLIIKSILMIVVIPLVMGDLTRRYILNKYGRDVFNRIKPNLSGISSIGVLIIVFLALSLKSQAIIKMKDMIMFSIIPLIIYYLAILVISHIVGNSYLERGDKIAFVFGVTMRNLTIALALALGTMDGGMAVFLIAIGYIVQVPLAAFYVKYLNRYSVIATTLSSESTS